MRRARPLFLIAILAIAGYLGETYRQRMAALKRDAPASPKPLPNDVNATATDWHWERSAGDGRPAVSVRAKNFRQIKEPSQFELEKVDLKIYRKDNETYDHVVSDRAVFDMAEGFLYSEGEADITMGVVKGEEPKASRLVHIKSSGIRFDSKTGKARTEREASFLFDRGRGRSVGAEYDPATHELILNSQAELIWHGHGKDKRAMKVQAGQVLYKEQESKVLLSPWAKLSRDNMTLEGKGAVVTLDKELGSIRLVETTAAKGVDRFPGRLLEYAADRLTMNLSEKSEVEKIKGQGNAQLTTTTEFGVTTTRTDQVDLDFDLQGNESVLRRALASGKTVVESKPLARKDHLPAETRLLRSEIVEMRMKPGGHEIDTLDTLTPAILEFLPNRPGQRKRRVEGDRFHVVYGAENHIESFHTTQAQTRTENAPKQGKPQPPALTTSKELTAQFAPKTGEMTRLEQSGDFRYEEGERKAQSERALLDQASNRITLLQSARVWDPTGSTTADRIVLDQRNEDFQADGNVNSSRLPDRQGGSSAMLSKDEPLQAKAARMNTTEKQSLIVYGGNALLWQGSSRLQAEHIEIDRKNSLLRANGKVMSQLLEQKEDPKTKKKTPVFTLIQAPAMLYSDKERMAHYTGGVTLRRAILDVKAREIKAFLKEQSKEKGKENDSSLEKASADGAVVIVQTTPKRVRRGTSEHADYFVDEEKVVLEKGEPELQDSVKGTTRGQQLIYYSNDDRLLVNGVPAQPAVSKIRRK
ncbi:MAG TPA: LPS export ABC transporter periplasmic protein LptC [Bryobacteraceae bacterium]|nr:LPS export ABC transporter periplasmic protein LptC [Bryobacteraceae bacterium]